MADGRKHEDIKVIKNPLLSQSFMLEELSGASIIVPTPPPKTHSVDSNGSKTGVDVPPFGEKKQGSPLAQGKGGACDVPQSSQSFTEIPLNVSGSKAATLYDKPPSSSLGSALISIIGGGYGQSKSPANVMPTLVSPAPLNAPISAKEGTNPGFGKGVAFNPKSQPILQTFEPQLVPPTSESTLNTKIITSENKPPMKVNLNYPTLIPPALPTQTEPEKSLISEPPRFSLPPTVSAQNNTGLKNPYALRNTHNTYSSSASRLSKSPPSTLGISDSIPLYSTPNVSNVSSNLFSFFSGPQVVASPSSGTFLVDPNSATPSVQAMGIDSANSELNYQSSTPELKPYQPSLKPSDAPPLTPLNPTIFTPQTTSVYTQNAYPELKQHAGFHTETHDSTKSSEILSQVSVNASIYPGQTTQHSYPLSESNNQEKSESKPHTNIPSKIPELQAVTLPNVYSGQNPLTSLIEKIQQTLPASTPQTKIENIVHNKTIPTFDSSTIQLTDSNAFSEEKHQPVPMIPIANTSLPYLPDFQNKFFQEKFKSVEIKSYHNQLYDAGKSAEISESDILPHPSHVTIKQPEESSSDSFSLQSKQVTSDNIHKNETQNAERNYMQSVNSSSLSQQSQNIQVTNPPSLSGFFTETQANIKDLPRDTTHFTVSQQPLTDSFPTPQPVSGTLPPSTYFHQVPSTSDSWNQHILNPNASAPIHNKNENFPPIQFNADSKIHTIGESANGNPTLGVTVESSIIPQPQNCLVSPLNVTLSTTIVTSTPPLPAISSTSQATSNYSIPFSAPQSLYNFPKLNPDSSTCIFPQQFNVAPPAGEKTDTTYSSPLVPTFNYFSTPQTSCLPPSLDQPLQKSSASSKAPSSSYYFKPIQTLHSVDGASQSSEPRNIEPPHPVINPMPSAPPNPLNFPPPNVSYPKDIPSTLKQQPTNIQTASLLPNRDNQNCSEAEELDQIPLEGSSVLLFNPETINRKKKVNIPGVGNTFRLSGGIRKPTYAPVPDLGVTGRRNYPPPTSSPSGLSVSSQEEMAAIHENQNKNGVGTSPTKTPESPLVVDNYYGNAMQSNVYRPPYNHWFFKCGGNKNTPWTPFSMADSLNLEQVFTSSDLNEDTRVSTDGGRYDVALLRRKKISVYWDEPDGEVRRCSWFVKSIADSRYIPYDENIAALLEDEYKQGFETNEWNRTVELADGEVIILHGPSAIAHHVRSASPDAWGSQPPLQQKPRVVKRGVEEFDIPKGEPKQVDHLLLVVHGIGKACDLRFRSLVEVVDDFRAISLQLVQSHFHSGVQDGMVGRVEVLPVEWHKALHTETIDDRLSAITLPSIPRAREFTNETLLDILFYTSPVFSEKIVQAIGIELNRVFTLYQKRNPGFRGQVSLGGHSLGSLILFDMLCNQKPVIKPHLSTQASLNEDDEDIDEVGCLMRKAKLSRRMSYLTMGPGTGQPYTIYPQLLFEPKAFFALGSPIGMFVTVRGVETLGEEFKFPTCPAFFNIFHPNDPVAYRIEALIKPEMAKIPAVLIPHHKGRKRMHLELKETMAHVTAALKQKLVDSMRNTWNTVYQLAMFNRKDHNLHGEVNKVIEDEVLREASYLESDPPRGIIGEEGIGNEMRVGKLNDGRRIDYVLQEAPLETFNQYISAVRSHLVYWESEDTMLLILKEIYGQMGISADSQVPQPILPFDISGESDSYSEYTDSIGAPPTQFVRK